MSSNTLFFNDLHIEVDSKEEALVVSGPVEKAPDAVFEMAVKAIRDFLIELEPNVSWSPIGGPGETKPGSAFVEDLRNYIQSRDLAFYVSGLKASLPSTHESQCLKHAIGLATSLGEVERLLDLYNALLPWIQKSAGLAQQGTNIGSLPNMVPLTSEEASLCKDGQRIAAIKLVRARLQIGLKEAKDIVDAWITFNKW